DAEVLILDPKKVDVAGNQSEQAVRLGFHEELERYFRRRVGCVGAAQRLGVGSQLQAEDVGVDLAVVDQVDGLGRDVDGEVETLVRIVRRDEVRKRGKRVQHEDDDAAADGDTIAEEAAADDTPLGGGVAFLGFGRGRLDGL